MSKMCSDDVSSSSENIGFVPAQFNLQPDEASASPDPKTSPRLSRASIFLTQILQVRKGADRPPATVALL